MTRIVKGRIIFDDEGYFCEGRWYLKGAGRKANETHERERRESLGGAVVRIHFFGAGLNPGLFGEISLDVHITLGDCTCVLT